jgi:O-antigen/teichoic acid export membrane protein
VLRRRGWRLQRRAVDPASIAQGAGDPDLELGERADLQVAMASEVSSYDTASSAVARGGIWSVGGQAASFGAALVATPFTLRLLGPGLYGLWSLLQSVLSWVGLADLGMTTASTRFGGESLAKRDTPGEVRAVWTAAAITISATTIAAGFVAWASPHIISGLLHVSHARADDGVLALRVLCAALIAQAVSGTLNTPQVIRLRWRSYTIISSGSGVLQVVAVPIALAATGGGVVTCAAVVLGAGALAAAATAGVGARLQPAMIRPLVSRQLAGKMLRYGGALTLSGVAAIPLTTAERLLLGHYRSTVEVAWYTVASRLGLLLTAVPSAVAAPLFPALVALRESGQFASARSLYRQALQGAFLVLTPTALALAFVAQPFLAAWAGDTYGRNSVDPFYIILVGVWFNSLAWIPISGLLAADRTALIARIHLLELVPYLAAAAWLTSAFGAVGAAIVWSARVILDSIVFFLASRRDNLPISPLADRAAASVAAPLILALILALLASVTSSLASRSALAVLLTAVYWLGAWRFMLTDRERRGLRAVARQIGPARWRASKA